MKPFYTIYHTNSEWSSTAVAARIWTSDVEKVRKNHLPNHCFKTPSQGLKGKRSGQTSILHPPTHFLSTSALFTINRLIRILPTIFQTLKVEVIIIRTTSYDWLRTTPGWKILSFLQSNAVSLLDLLKCLAVSWTACISWTVLSCELQVKGQNIFCYIHFSLPNNYWSKT